MAHPTTSNFFEQRMEPGRSASTQELRVTEIDRHADARWEKFVRSHPDALVYHQTGWLNALEKEYGRGCLVLACEDAQNQLLAVLPLMYTRGLPFNLGKHQTTRRLSSLPRTPFAGPLSVDPGATAAVLREAMNRVATQRGVRLEIKSDKGGLELLAHGLFCLPWRFRHVIELNPRIPGSEPGHNGRRPCSSELRFGKSRNFARIKWAVTKAGKQGVRVRRATDKGELRGWYEIYLETLRRNAVPPRPFRFFEAAWDSLPPGTFSLLLAEQECGGGKRLLAGSVFLQHGRAVSYAFNGCHREDFYLRPNDLLQWHAIQRAFTDPRVREYDLGEVPLGNEPLAKFKSKWGAKPRQLYRYYYPAPDFTADQPRGEGAYVNRLGERVWQRMPLRWTATLGDWIYSYL